MGSDEVRILFIVPSNYKKIGGIYLIVDNYTQILLERGIVVDVLGYPYRYTNKEEKNNNKDRIKAALLKNEYKVVLTYALNISTLIMDVLKEVNYQGRKISFMVDSMPLYSKSLLKYMHIGKDYITEKARLYVYKHKENKCISFYDKLIYVSEVDKEFTIKRHETDRHKIFCVPNGTLLPDLREGSTKNNEMVLGLLTGFSDETLKNNVLPFVDSIFPKLIECFPEIKLVIAGRGAPETFVNMISKRSNINYIGPVERLEDFYNMIDISIITVKKECGIINRVLEAWAYATPTVGFARNFKAFKYALDRKHYYSADNLAEFKEAIVFFKESNTIEKMGLEDRLLVETNYTWIESAETLLDIIQEENDKDPRSCVRESDGKKTIENN